jgi:hypothetical protein
MMSALHANTVFGSHGGRAVVGVLLPTVTHSFAFKTLFGESLLTQKPQTL